MSVAKHPILVVIILYVITVEEDIYVLARLVTLEKLTSVLVRNFFTLLVRGKKEDLYSHGILSSRVKFSCLVTRLLSYYLLQNEICLILLCCKTRSLLLLFPQTTTQQPKQIIVSLRTVPTIVSAYTFCTSCKACFNCHACTTVYI